MSSITGLSVGTREATFLRPVLLPPVPLLLAAGPTCQEPLLPACQTSPDAMPFWGIFVPKSCECYRQAAKFFNCTQSKLMGTCQIMVYQSKLATARCFELENKPVAEQWSAWPAEGTPGVTWHQINEDFTLRPLPEDRGRRAINLWGHDLCRPQPLPSCPDGCSQQGVCLKVRGAEMNRPGLLPCQAQPSTFVP